MNEKKVRSVIKKNKIRLVALIEEIKKGNYKIINFVRDIEIKKVIENGVHKQDVEGRYCFYIEKKDIFQIPYAKNLVDLSVIVGENGSGKTTIINKIFREYRGVLDYLIFEKDNEIIIYRWLGADNLSISQENKYFRNIEHTSLQNFLNIIKFSNALELSYDSLKSPQNLVDGSKFKNLYNKYNIDEDEKNISLENGKIIELLEIINQIKFVTDIKGRISEFVDYTKKGVSVDFEGDGLPYFSKQLEYLDRVDKLSVSEEEKKVINKRLIDYFSILINYTIDTDYNESNSQKNEELLKCHLLFLENNSNVELQYQLISVDSDRFLPFKYSIGGLREVVPDKILNDQNSEFWIEIWHICFVMNLYFEYRRMNKGGTDNYRNKITMLLNKLSLVNKFIIRTENNKELDSYVENIELFYKKNDDNSFNNWSKFWKGIKKPCERVARSLSYTSYFKLEGYGYFIKHKLEPNKVWMKLSEVGTSNNEIDSLKKIEALLYQLQKINTDFKTLTEIVECGNRVSKFDLSKYLQIRWTGLSSGELALLKSFANLYSAKLAIQEKIEREEDKKNYLLLLDEVDLGLHPRWQRKWISTALPIIEKIFEDKNLQIIITTHSPIFLSDIFIENIIFLTKGRDDSKERIYEKTFGQNIYTLFKNSFFLDEDELMGEYAYQKIEDTIEFLRFKIRGGLEIIREESLYYKQSEENAQKISRKIIDSIGEKIIANQLNELFNIAYPDYEKDIDDIEREIKRLQNKLRNLKEGNSQ